MQSIIFSLQLLLKHQLNQGFSLVLLQEVLKAFVEQGENWEWTEHSLHEKLEAFRGEFKEKGIKPKATMWAIRGAITGRTRGADMTATLDIIGKENCLARAKKAIRA